MACATPVTNGNENETIESESSNDVLRREFTDLDIIEENERNFNLDKFWQEKANTELGETSIISNERLEKLRELIKTNTRSGIFPVNGRQDNAFLLRFLRAKKFDESKAHKMMTKYYTMKQNFPEFFKVSPIQDLADLLKMQIQFMLPNRDENGRRIYIFRVKNLDPNKCAVETVFRTNVLALENVVRESKTQIVGLIVLLDMSGSSLGHAKFIAPNLSRRRTVEVIQEAFPLRFKAFHIINQPFYFDAVLAVLKPFLKDKIRNRIFLHDNDLNSLHNYISKEFLPLEYGGFQPSFDNTEWRQKLLSDDEYFNRLENFSFTEITSKHIPSGQDEINENS